MAGATDATTDDGAYGAAAGGPDAAEATRRFLAKYGVDKLAPQWGLSAPVCATLRAMGVTSFFPVQAVAIPKVLDKSHDRITDICINAPTGSGKTLVYVVPIVQRLLPRVVCRVRALIVLPSRDLAIQVHAIVARFCANTPLKCGLAIGQSNFAAEQASLVGKAAGGGLFKGSAGVLDGGRSLVDILVATPGRLVDHLEQTPGFTLQHLQFLVVDEADRLLNQSYQDWIAKIYASIFNGQDVEETRALQQNTQQTTAMTLRRQDSINRRRIRTSLTRVLLSATLTRNPRKLASIGMSNAELTKIGRIDDPLADNAKVGDDAASDGDEDDEEEEDDEDGDKAKDGEDDQDDKAKDKDKEKMYATPANLEELVIECDTGSKPLVLLEILSDYKAAGLSIVFTSSVNSTHRLARLLQLHAEQPERVREYSSSLTQKQRTALVADCKLQKVDVVVCSDAMARGMDIENVANVINYDVPSYVKTYIHRVGRTARAGRHGRAVTLVKMGQMKGMLRMLKKAENKKLIPYALDEAHMKTLVPKYTKALQLLKDTLEAEKDGKLAATAAVDKLHHAATAKQDAPAAASSAPTAKPKATDEDEAAQELHASERKRVFAKLYEQIELNLDAWQKQRTH